MWRANVLSVRGELSKLCRAMTAKKSLNLEKALADLESLVDELESGDLPLEKALQKFEDGIKLTRQCQAALREAEQKVTILMQSAGEETLEMFDPGDD
jgi:exodeoxyribonuclease VII small subunit